ncbi:arsenate reductase (azurin) large subunit [Chloroflexus aggregans]|uniref:Arsenite oxidase, large subunit n=1 Tax=Chloroflexus aggregans (strain MD-66 / DSM 9485) TaxID=326427 RepID=B8G319_CHLAD|nr:arsenate reductase (azurin) large subunit [Chloroflexus aggregans]ACL23323.1 arsenite oxidase, large subunit [Chloroflexus aggregans DSM 9485]
MAIVPRFDQLPIPPANAAEYNTVCQFCNVGCGYKVYVWPVDESGDVAATTNAFKLDLSKPQPALAGQSYTETMHSITVGKDGRQYHVVIVPAMNSPINQGNYSYRGGANALTVWSLDRGTQDRLTYPLLRVGDQFQAITWQDALALIAGVIKGIRDRDKNDDNIAVKCYDHGGSGAGFEDNYGAGKLFFDALSVKHIAIHNRPAYNSEVWGSRERGVHELNYDYSDARLADTVVLWGANSYETATILYTQHILANIQGATVAEKRKAFDQGEPAEPGYLIVIDPRKTSSYTVAETVASNQVLLLQPNFGTDYILAHAIARVVWERSYYDLDYLKARTDMKLFEEYKQKNLKLDKKYADFMAEAERITGVPKAKIEQAADWIAKPKAGKFKRRTLTIYEKGIIWNMKNYDQVAALVQLAVLTHNIGRPGTGCGRQGGHQEGYVRPPAPTPGSIYNGGPPVNVDKFLIGGKGKFYWVIANDPYLSTPNNQIFRKRIHERTTKLTKALGESGEAATIQGRIDAILKALYSDPDALFMVVQDIYMTETARDAHLILPAAGWGEANDTSINCNSRLLRLYEKFMDPPGEAKPDWEIFKLVGEEIAKLYRAAKQNDVAAKFEFGKNWKTDEDVFLAGAQEFKDNQVSEEDEATLEAENYKGVTYAFLKQKGQEGIRTPVRRDPKTKNLVGTLRRYTSKFGTADGKFKWYATDNWEGYPAEVAKYLDGTKAKEYPFWVTTGRIQHLWQSTYHDRHLPEREIANPLPYAEINPDDAKKLNIQSGDLIEIYNEEGNAIYMAYVTDAVKPGTIFMVMYHWRGTSNSLVSGYTDSKTTIPWYKGTRANIRKVGNPPTFIQLTASTLQQNKFN